MAVIFVRRGFHCSAQLLIRDKSGRTYAKRIPTGPKLDTLERGIRKVRVLAAEAVAKLSGAQARKRGLPEHVPGRPRGRVAP